MTIKFLQNGIRADGKYFPVYYSLRDSDKAVCVRARTYGKLPEELGEIINNSDSMTDYFEKDRCYITRDDPRYFAARAAYRQGQLSALKKRVTIEMRNMAKYPHHRERHEAFIEELRAEIKRLGGEIQAETEQLG